MCKRNGKSENNYKLGCCENYKFNVEKSDWNSANSCLIESNIAIKQNYRRTHMKDISKIN